MYTHTYTHTHTHILCVSRNVHRFKTVTQTTLLCFVYKGSSCEFTRCGRKFSNAWLLHAETTKRPLAMRSNSTQNHSRCWSQHIFLATLYIFYFRPSYLFVYTRLTLLFYFFLNSSYKSKNCTAFHKSHPSWNRVFIKKLIVQS